MRPERLAHVRGGEHLFPNEHIRIETAESFLLE